MIPRNFKTDLTYTTKLQVNVESIKKPSSEAFVEEDTISYPVTGGKKNGFFFCRFNVILFAT